MTDKTDHCDEKVNLKHKIQNITTYTMDHYKDKVYLNANLLNTYRQHCAPESGVLADYSRVDLLAEHRAVVIDVKEVNVNSYCVTE